MTDLFNQPPVTTAVSGKQQAMSSGKQQAMSSDKQQAMSSGNRQVARSEQQVVSVKHKRGSYHDNRGKFTDKETAARVSIQKEIQKYKNGMYFYKRVNERLSREVAEEKAKVARLEKELKNFVDRVDKKDN